MARQWAGKRGLSPNALKRERIGEIIMPRKKVPKIPVLRRGEGTMILTAAGTIEYKKVVKRGDGTKIRKTVHGKTADECFAKMEEVERNEKRGFSTADKTPLIDELEYWLEYVKKTELSPASYRRLAGTIKNRIRTSDIGHYRYQSITERELRQFIIDLNKLERYSYSEIRKVWLCLNEFYRYVSNRDGFQNPMELIDCIKEKAVKVDKKKIEYLDADDIPKFIKQAISVYKSSGNPRYKYGPMYAANIFLGMRIGEMAALKWGDINFDRRTIKIVRTQTQTESKTKTGKKESFVVQKYLKTYNSYREISINARAWEYIQLYQDRAEFISDNDFVLSTRTGRMITPKNAQDTIGAIITGYNKECEPGNEIKISSSNTHILRHTCASLYFNAGVSPIVISKILGNTVDVLEKTYIHIWPGVFKETAELIENIDGLNLF